MIFQTSSLHTASPKNHFETNPVLRYLDQTRVPFPLFPDHRLYLTKLPRSRALKLARNSRRGSCAH